MSDCNNNTLTGIDTSTLSGNKTNNSPISPDLPHVVRRISLLQAISDLAHLVEPFEPPLDQVLLIVVADINCPCIPHALK